MWGSRGSTRFGVLVAVVGCGACGHDWDAYAPLAVAGSSVASASSGPGGHGGTGAQGGGAGGTGGGAGATGGAATGGAGGAGPGGGGPVHCGGPSLLVDGFDDQAATDLEIGLPTGASVSGGDAIIPLPISATSVYRTFSSRRWFDLTGDAISFEVTKMVDSTTTASMYALLELDSDNYIRIRQKEGQTQLLAYVGGVTAKLVADPWDPVAHAQWRIRETMGTTYLETSPDGSTWDPKLDIATSDLFPLDLLDVDFGASIDGGELAADEARFGSINAATATGEPWCKTGSLSDDFGDGTIARAWGRRSTGAACNVTETGGQAVVTLLAGMMSACQYMSAAAFDLTSDSVAVRVPLTTFALGAGETYLTLETSGGDEIEIVQSTDELRFKSVLGGVSQEHGSVEYDPAVHIWWRISELAGTTYFETSPDGTVWTLGASAKNTIDVTALDVRFGVSNYAAAVLVPLVAQFDDYNVAP